MDSIRPLLERMAPEVQSQVKSALSGILTGGIVRNYLPQEWVFRTEVETLTFHVDQRGDARILDGPSDRPDVTIKAPQEDLEAILGEQRIPPGADQRVEVVYHTRKGRAAWNLLRRRLGF